MCYCGGQAEYTMIMGL